MSLESSCRTYQTGHAPQIGELTMTDKEFVMSIYPNARIVENKGITDLKYKMMWAESNSYSSYSLLALTGVLGSEEYLWRVAAERIRQDMLYSLVK